MSVGCGTDRAGIHLSHLPVLPTYLDIARARNTSANEFIVRTVVNMTCLSAIFPRNPSTWFSAVVCGSFSLTLRSSWVVRPALQCHPYVFLE